MGGTAAARRHDCASRRRRAGKPVGAGRHEKCHGNATTPPIGPDRRHSWTISDASRSCLRRRRSTRDDLEGVRFNQIVEEIQRSGFEVIKARRIEDAEIAVKTDAAIGCMMVDWGKKGMEGKTASLIKPDAPAAA